MSAGREMPQYQCHKKVWALKIQSISIERSPDGKIMITPEEPGYAAFEVSREWFNKHNPQVGGYYVVYEDDYKSFSPAKAFDDGYAKVGA